MEKGRHDGAEGESLNVRVIKGDAREDRLLIGWVRKRHVGVTEVEVERKRRLNNERDDWRDVDATDIATTETSLTRKVAGWVASKSEVK